MQSLARVCAMLFADRFLVTDRGRTVDLASGSDVTVKRASVCDRALDDWMRRCAALLELACSSIVPVVDYGEAGHGHHFETLGCRQPRACWGERDERTARMLAWSVASLHARGLSAGRLEWARVIEVGGQPMLLPDDETGLPLDGEDEDAPRGDRAAKETERLSRMLSACGPGGARAVRPGHPRDRVRASGLTDGVRQDILCRLTDVLETGCSGRPRAVHLPLPPLAAPVLVNVVARACRLQGYVPLNALVCSRAEHGPDWADGLPRPLRGRHVAVLYDPGEPAAAAAAASVFVVLGLDSHRPHVLFALGGRSSPSYPQHDGARALQAREHEARYEGAAALAAVRDPEMRQPAPVKPQARIANALENAARGRHASAARALREALGMLSRRNDRAGAAESALALGRLLLTRGQVVEAAEAFEQARALFDAARMAPHSIAAVVFVGLAWTDAGRWLEAEAAVRAGLIAAGTLGDGRGSAMAGLALSRCLLWQGRHREALEALPPEDPWHPPADRVAERDGVEVASACRGDTWWPATPDPRVARAALAARIAVACHDLRSAGAAAAAARERATLGRRPGDVALACTALAQVYAALGDVEALRRQAREGLDAARLSHAPLRALRLRLALADGLVRAGRAAEARPLLARLARLDAGGLPAVVRQPLQRVLDLGREAAPREAPCADRAALAGAVRSDVVEAVVEVLGFCQSTEDEQALAGKIVGALRARTGAAATACFGLDDTGVVAIAAEGTDPLPSAVARRAADAGLVIPPSSTSSGLEAAVPVRLGGGTIGALACRWPADSLPAWGAAGAILTAAAAALAPGLRAALDRRAAPAAPAGGPVEEIAGTSEALRLLRDEIVRAAHAPFNVVIEGESGSGKELVARAIHRLGPRRHHRLCAINCAALTDELLEAELFGHARGAFTGAVAERRGLFEEADGGSLVLDEIGELTPRAQAKLLRAIQEGEIRRLGENFARPVDVRIVAASNRPLRTAAEEGAFRRDLLYRLEVIRIVVPPLRERVDDIPLLAVRFWQQATTKLGSRATLAPATLAALARYDWPGNVRELQNVMAALAVAAGRRGSVGPERLPAIIAREAAGAEAATLEEARRVFEARYVRAAIARAGGHRTQAAHDLGLTRQGLSKLLARLRISAPDVGAPGESKPLPG